MTATTTNQCLDKLLSKYSSSELQKNVVLSKWRKILFTMKLNFGGNYKVHDPNKVNYIIDNGQEPNN